MSDTGSAPAPWSRPAPRLAPRDFLRIGAGAVVASFYIGTGDITIATAMGARFGFSMWWTYVVLGLAGWAMVDMSVRYFLATGRTPVALFKELHPFFGVYLLVTVVVTSTVGAYSQWNACAHVISGVVPGFPSEAGGAFAAMLAAAIILTGAYKRIEALFVVGLIALVLLFLAAALATEVDWSEAWAGLVPSGPREPKEVWYGLVQSNAGSLINAWLILVYPYTMIERRHYGGDLDHRLGLLKRARWDYGLGIAAAGIVALPILAAAHAVAGPFGIVPKNGSEFAVLLEPVAGARAGAFFLVGLFLAAWTAGIGWMVCGAYALCDLAGLPLRMDSRPFRQCLAVFTLASAGILYLRVNPFDGIRIFAAFLAVVFPVVAIALVWRVSRPDLGYFRWSWRNPRGLFLVVLDSFALIVSLWVGFGMIGRFFAS